MEFSNFLYHVQQSHFPTVKPIIIVTENKTAQEELTGRPHVRAGFSVVGVKLHTGNMLNSVVSAHCVSE